jgi:hypothetical protein
MMGEGRCHRGEGVPPLRGAGILPAIEGKMPSPRRSKGKMPSPRAVQLLDNRAKEQA